MPTITLTQRYNDLDDWPGNLFEADPTTTVLARTATSFVFRHGAGSDFEGFRVQVYGSGFAYEGTQPLDGTVAQVRVVDAAGQVVLSLTGLVATPIANDLAQFVSNVFGSPFPDAGPGPNGKVAWSHLTVGNDTIVGTAGDDREVPWGVNAGNDTFDMGAGDDDMLGGVGNDTYYGGEGDDWLRFSESTFNEGMSAFRGAVINNSTGVAQDPWGGTDRFFGVEEFEGSRFDDTYIGTADRDREDHFMGLRGRDVFYGGSATFDGAGDEIGDDDDTALHYDDYWRGGSLGIVVNLETALNGGHIVGTIRDGFGNLDRVRDVEEVEGTRFGDVFNGSRVDNEFTGGEGRDTFDGRGGRDSVKFRYGFADDPTSGINVNLALGANQVLNDGYGNAETAVGIEDVHATNLNDVIRMTAGDNEVRGRDGQDVMVGAGGRDTFVWVEGDEFGDFDRVTDFAVFGAGADVLAFNVEEFDGMTTTLRLVNGTAATTNQGTFLFNGASSTLSWDEDGTGAAVAEVVVILNGRTQLTAANFELWD